MATESESLGVYHIVVHVHVVVTVLFAGAPV